MQHKQKEGPRCIDFIEDKHNSQMFYRRIKTADFSIWSLSIHHRYHALKK